MDQTLKRLRAPISNASLVVFRVLFGIAMFTDMERYANFGWAELHFSSDVFRFSYPGFHWVHALPGLGMTVFFHFQAALALCIWLGLFYRVAMPLFTLGFAYIFLIDKANYLNHFYLIILVSFLLNFVPCHRALSLDALRRPEIASDRAPSWTLWILLAQQAFVYIYGAIAKMNVDWLTGQPIGPWLASFGHLPVVGPWLEQHWVALFFAYGGMGFDLLVIPALLWSRSRPAALVVLFGFHLCNHFLFEIGIFPWLMMAASLLFLPPDWPHALGRLWPEATASEPDPPLRPHLGRAGLGLLCLYFAVQLFLPLRQHLYPGNPAWTGQGVRFAWRMKLNQREGRLDVRYRSDRSPQLTAVPVRRFLTDTQARQLLNWPDMVVDFAHYLEKQLEEAGHRDVEVYASASISLNGTLPREIFDTTVDLSEVRSGSFRHDTWLLAHED